MRIFLPALLILLCAHHAFAEDFSAAKPGDVLHVSLNQLHPTQLVIGYDQVYYKLGRFIKEPKKLFDEYCETNGQGESSKVSSASELQHPATFACAQTVGSRSGDMKTVVIGPKGALYLTDGHHTFTTLWEQPGGGAHLKMWVRVTDNFSDSADMGSFWTRMQQARKAWLKDANGNAINPAQLPPQLGLSSLQNDPYRALVYFAREVGYDKPRSGEVAPEFLEFYWGDWLREALPLSRYDLSNQSDYRDAVEAVAQLMVSLPPQTQVGDSGFTAAQLGGYQSLDRKELGKMATRKLGYMLDYKSSL